MGDDHKSAADADVKKRQSKDPSEVYTTPDLDTTQHRSQKRNRSLRSAAHNNNDLPDVETEVKVNMFRKSVGSNQDASQLQAYRSRHSQEQSAQDPDSFGKQNTSQTKIHKGSHRISVDFS